MIDLFGENNMIEKSFVDENIFLEKVFGFIKTESGFSFLVKTENGISNRFKNSFPQMGDYIYLFTEYEGSWLQQPLWDINRIAIDSFREPITLDSVKDSLLNFISRYTSYKYEKFYCIEELK